ncbi:sigma-70 family RNA polymerase sigma factor [Seongchinamella sediminis]|uniref:Sigma-70 family RNA polymerase sigma factor n=1 Tax=Seongchinamella sediminis TaxID=2283635 RepID=A0A3L7DYN8_9GAMM|nr:RNA polymerase sigma factor [Seongchinamella sediminis]RLQ21111.1 sigma-70 family RNA polymerase sigma factor [Seongchinamella sediminis]
MTREISKLHGRLQRYVSRFCKTREDAEDITQEAFLRVLEAGSKGDIRHPQAYLYRTARNLSLNMLASKSHQLSSYIEDLPDTTVIEDGVPLDSQISHEQRFELFCHAALDLPERCREVLILRKVYGLSQKQVAERLDISISTVEKHLAKALARCAAYMQRVETGGYDHHAETSVSGRTRQ